MENQTKWYFRTTWVIIAFLFVGPFALPLVWFNPRFNRLVKIIVTLAVAALTYYLATVLINSIKAIATYYQQLFQI
ncbi:MAG: hypothetical protein PHF11_07135 [Candidatus Omnitrophica bacterium]|nr:hypothetical protein [Candidatus Omnitrophota bacterium]